MTGRGADRVTYGPGPQTGRIGLALVAVALVVFFTVRHDNFLAVGNAVAITVNMSSVLIAGVGSAVLLIMGKVDLSIGSMYGLLGMVVAEVAATTASPVLAVVAGLVAGAALGAFNGLLVRILDISPLIVTIGLLAVYAGLAYVISPNSIFGFDDDFIEVGRGTLAGIPIPVVVAAVVMLVGGFVLTRTVVGLHAYAIGGDERAAGRAGIRVPRLVLGAYTVNGLLIGLIAVLTTAKLGTGAPNLGAGFEFDVLTAVILGGVAFSGGAGRPIGLLIGVLTIGILNSGLVFEGLQSWWQQIAKGAILVAALGADKIAARRRAGAVARSDPATATATASTAVPTEQLELAADLASTDVSCAHSDEPVLELRGVSKTYGAVRALDATSLRVAKGEVLALLGDNGAGKSTLVKIIAGAVHPDTGDVVVGDEPRRFKDPADARAVGLQTVYQDLALCPNLSVTHNLVLGNEPTRLRLGVLRVRDDRRAQAETRRRLAALGIELADLTALVEALSGGQRQAIAIARTLDDGVRLVCLDEPTAALGVTQTANVVRLIKSISRRGTAVVIITHDISLVQEVADNVAVMRHGQLAFHGQALGMHPAQLLHLMSGLEPPAATGS